jgi:hypothetical protein
LPDARGLTGIGRLGKANRRGFGAPAYGVEQGELRGNLDAAAAALGLCLVGTEYV